MRDRHGDWIQTFSGGKFYPLDPRPEDIEIADIAHALSNMCRFTGHVKKFYSVAQHSVVVANTLETQGWSRGIQLAGLLHDASEAWISDVSTPLKRTPMMAPYRDTEQYVMAVVAKKFGLEWPFHVAVHEADQIVTRTEARDLLPTPPIEGWNLTGDMLLNEITPWCPLVARTVFIRRFLDLYYERGPRRGSF